VCFISVEIVESIIVCWAMGPIRRVPAKSVVMIARRRFRCYAMSAPSFLVGRIRNVLLSLVSTATLLAVHPIARLN